MKTLLLAIAFLAIGITVPMAQTNPNSPDAVDTEMELAWPDWGVIYINALNQNDNEIAIGAVIGGSFTNNNYINWQETSGGNGEQISVQQSGSGTNLENWSGGRWPEFGGYYGAPAPVDPMLFGSYNNQHTYNNEFYVGSVANVTVARNDQSQAMLITGGAPGATGMELYQISGSAEETYIVYDRALWGSTAIPPEQIQVGNLGSFTTATTNYGIIEGTLWVALPKHTEVPVTPRVSGSHYYNAGISAQPYELVSQCVATTPANRARTTIGVGEQVVISFNPTLPTNVVWSTTAGGLSSITNANTTFTAPSNAANATITATVAGKSVSMDFKVVEPSTETSVTNSIETFPAGTEGVGMHLTVTWGPTNVSFYRVQIMEVAGPASNVTGCFTNYPLGALDHHPNTNWVTLSSDNATDDEASISGVPQIIWYPGGFDLDIPVIWKIISGSITNNFPHDELQSFRMTDMNGTTTVSKLGSSTTRTP